MNVALLERIGSIFKVKEPWRASERSLAIVVPIVQEGDVDQRGYVVLDEVKDEVKISDTGRIGEVKIEGDIDRPVFVRGGTLLKGATQERATQFGTVLVPNKAERIKVQERIKVHCVHASKGIVPMASMALAGLAPHKVYSAMAKHRNQSATWSAVSSYNASIAEPYLEESAMAQRLHPVQMGDDLVGTVESVKAFRKELNEALQKIPDYMGQVGVCIIDPDGVVGLELYDHPDSWKAFSESIVRTFSDSITKEDRTGIFKPAIDKVLPVIMDFIKGLEKATEEDVFNGNGARTVVIKVEGYVGEYTELGERQIHLLVTREEKEEPYRPTPVFYPTVQRTAARVSRAEPGWHTSYMATAMPSSWQRRPRKIRNVLDKLDKSPKTWTQLMTSYEGSKATLSSALNELQISGLVSKEDFSNGSKRYSITGLGQEALKEKAKEKRS